MLTRTSTAERPLTRTPTTEKPLISRLGPDFSLCDGCFCTPLFVRGGSMDGGGGGGCSCGVCCVCGGEWPPALKSHLATWIGRPGRRWCLPTPRASRLPLPPSQRSFSVLVVYPRGGPHRRLSPSWLGLLGGGIRGPVREFCLATKRRGGGHFGWQEGTPAFQQRGGARS